MGKIYILYEANWQNAISDLLCLVLWFILHYYIITYVICNIIDPTIIFTEKNLLSLEYNFVDQ